MNKKNVKIPTGIWAIGFVSLFMDASAVAGSLWQMLGAAASFYAGAGFAGVALMLLLVSFRSRHWA